MGCGPGHVARDPHEAGTRVFGLDLSPRMIENARKLSPHLVFRVGNMMDLDLTGKPCGDRCFLLHCEFSQKESLAVVFRKMDRVLRPGGQLFLAFHIGDRVTEEDALGSHPISMDFFLFQPAETQRQLDLAGFAIEDIIEREPLPRRGVPEPEGLHFCAKSVEALLGSSAMT